MKELLLRLGISRNMGTWEERVRATWVYPLVGGVKLRALGRMFQIWRRRRRSVRRKRNDYGFKQKRMNANGRKNKKLKRRGRASRRSRNGQKRLENYEKESDKKPKMRNESGKKKSEHGG
jgi:hypothetical protein